MKRVGFFAGSFDPIHDGHVEVAKSAVQELDLDELFIMVEEQPWGDKQPCSIDDRRNMVTLALGKEDKIAQLELPENQFTIDTTLKILEQKYPEHELFFVFGADVFLNMNKVQWPYLSHLLEHKLVIFERNDIKEQVITSHANELGIEVTVLPSRYGRHSSSDVRIKSHNKQLWVPELVANYIDEHQLYKTIV